jgi:hypothetical protein
MNDGNVPLNLSKPNTLRNNVVVWNRYIQNVMFQELVSSINILQGIMFINIRAVTLLKVFII